MSEIFANQEMEIYTISPVLVVTLIVELEGVVDAADVAVVMVVVILVVVVVMVVVVVVVVVGVVVEVVVVLVVSVVGWLLPENETAKFNVYNF